MLGGRLLYKGNTADTFFVHAHIHVPVCGVMHFQNQFMESMHRCADYTCQYTKPHSTKVFYLKDILLIVTLRKKKLNSCIQTIKTCTGST